MKHLAKKTAKKHSDILPEGDVMWSVAWAYISTVIDTAREPFLILDENLRVLSANKTFYRFFRVTKKATEHTLVYKLGDGQWNIPALRKLLGKILPKSTFFANYEVDHDFPRIGRKIICLNARRIYAPKAKRPIVLLAMEDITRRKETEENLRDYAVKLKRAIRERTHELELRIKQLEKTDDVA
ncbi:MAG: PAS domain-containing protein [bacterium]|nr:PAS domain-containing protein [bacterium]